MRIEIHIERDAVEALLRGAVHERRPADLQAEVLLRRALGLPDVAPSVREPSSDLSRSLQAVTNAR